MLDETGFEAIEIGPPVDTFGGAKGETNARAYDVYGYAFLARTPGVTIAGDEPAVAAAKQHAAPLSRFTARRTTRSAAGGVPVPRGSR